ncbi:hypothetical protein DUNSADRAFT_8599 [Dunaliella salina]|uniref:Encoded protein n=1 Tax=Dunaliella salina TaxID=3046 RepID=A0ABQ7H5R0_DUNSA|nr:hypothetical protein DUNSADRAFT_8599 [Dunaliella salina]|eukprot:KAF5842199.1 hypothetical protein DUNSADRAFT_8599 [Dunaliella salina]
MLSQTLTRLVNDPLLILSFSSIRLLLSLKEGKGERPSLGLKLSLRPDRERQLSLDLSPLSEENKPRIAQPLRDCSLWEGKN